MPYYIEEIDAASQWYDDRTLLRHKEVIISGKLEKCEAGSAWLYGCLHTVKLGIGVTHIHGVELRYEDYPSREVRDGTIKPEVTLHNYVAEPFYNTDPSCGV